MSLLRMAWRGVWSRAVITLTTLLGIALGTALISAIFTFYHGSQQSFKQESTLYDLVVGAKGSPLQLVLSSVYHLDVPTGNIAFTQYQEMRMKRNVELAIPVGLGDNFQGFRIVGTSRELFDLKFRATTDNPEPRKVFHLAEGELFAQDFEAVIGAEVAQETGLEIGDQFYGTHGIVELAGSEVHDDMPYIVVGILKPGGTSNDRGIFTPLSSIWKVHDYEDDRHAEMFGSGNDVEDSETGAEKSDTDEINAEEEEDAPAGRPGALFGSALEESEDDGKDGSSEESDSAQKSAAPPMVKPLWGGADMEEGFTLIEDPAQIDQQEELPAFFDAAIAAQRSTEREVTAVLIQLRNIGLRLWMVDQINNETEAMAAIPINEMLRLYQRVLGPIMQLLIALAFLVILVSALSITTTLYQAAERKRRDLAILRTLGAYRREVMFLVFAEGMLLILLGMAAGWFIGHGGLALFAGTIRAEAGVLLEPWMITTGEIQAYAVIATLGLVASLIPAFASYRRSPAADL